MTDERGGRVLGGRGGSAAASGMLYQAGVGALFAVRMLAETPLDDSLVLNIAESWPGISIEKWPGWICVPCDGMRVKS